MASFLPTKIVSQNLRKPGSGISGLFVKYLLKKKNRILSIETVGHCNIQPDDYVLELGFGPGLGLEAAAAKISNGSGKLYGMDFSPAMMGEAMGLLEPVITAGNAQLTIGNVADLPYRDTSIDVIYHCNCYYFWDDPSKVLHGIHRVLKPSGRMVTGLCLAGLNDAGRSGVLRKEMYDSDQYMERLRAANFKVEMEEFPFLGSDVKYQIINATKS